MTIHRRIRTILGYRVPIHPIIIHPICTIVVAGIWLFAILFTIHYDTELYQRPAHVVAIDHYLSYDIVTIATLSSSFQKQTVSNKYTKGQRIYVDNYDTELDNLLCNQHAMLLYQFIVGYFMLGGVCAYISYRHSMAKHINTKKSKLN